MTFAIGQTVSWHDYSHLRGVITFGPFSQRGAVYWVIHNATLGNDYFVRASRLTLTVLDPSPEYEYGIDVLEGDTHSQRCNTIWTNVDAFLPGHYRRIKGRPETIEWISDRAGDLRPKPPEPEYEVLCRFGYVNTFFWMAITEKSVVTPTPPDKGYIRRIKGKPESIEWIAGGDE